MVQREMMENKLLFLYSWIESWHQKEGYGGVLHHAIHGTVNWYHAKLVPSYTYEPLMNGFINLYQSTGNIYWLKKAEVCANELMDILDRANQFKYSGFEFAPRGGGIVHTINPLFSMLKLYNITHRKEYLDTVRKVLESVVCIFWKGKTLSGPFNMTLMVAAAFAEYGRISGDWKLHYYYGSSCFEKVKKHKVGAEGGAAEGLYYRNEADHSIIFPWYNTIKAIAMLRYGRAINNQFWIEEGKRLLNKLAKILKSDFTYPHSYQEVDGIYSEINDVRLVAPTALAITWMSQEGILNSEDTEKAMETIMNTQSGIGFVPANYGYDWRSLIGVTSWNCFVFEMLTTKYTLKDTVTTNLPNYFTTYGNVFVNETMTDFVIGFKGRPLVIVNKKTGVVYRQFINCDAEFSINPTLMYTHPHIVRINAQRHFAVAYTDDSGRSVWMEPNKGNLSVWSPSNYLIIDKDYTIHDRGKQKYEKYAPVLYKILKPIVYQRALINIAMKIIQR